MCEIVSYVQETLKDTGYVQAMDEKMKTLEINQTREIVERQGGQKFVGYRWICIVKHKSDDNFDRQKARLVVKRFPKTYDVNCEDTFALGANMNIVGILWGLATRILLYLGDFSALRGWINDQNKIFR